MRPLLLINIIMSDIIDLRDLGKRYTILGKDGIPMQTIHLIQESEILCSAQGEYDFDSNIAPEEYIRESIKCLKGFIDHPENISWYIPENPQVIDLVEIALIAIRDKNSTVIIQK